MTIIQDLRSSIHSTIEINLRDNLGLNDLRNEIKSLLPKDINVSKGQIRKSEVEISKVFDIIIYQPTSANEDTIYFEDVLAIIEIGNQTTTDLKESLKRFSDFKRMFKDDFSLLRNKTIKEKKDKFTKNPDRMFSKIRDTPYLLLYIKYSEEIEEINEDFFNKLHKISQKIDFSNLPDEIVIDPLHIWFLNPILFRKKLTGYEIGWSFNYPPKSVGLCEICKRKVYRSHFYYKLLCQQCGDFNYLKLIEKADLAGRIALVSGARVKIGYHVALRLLRSGAQLVALTRFPHDAAIRYSKESDFDQWQDRLHIYGLDFRDLSGVTAFIEYFQKNYPYLDILINNAAQTVRHPPIYYRHLMENERKSVDQLPTSLKPLLKYEEKFQKDETSLLLEDKKNALVPYLNHNFQKSAELSQIPLTEGDLMEYGEKFPEGQYNQYGEQLDLRNFNSWVTKIDEVSIPEIIEVQLINNIVPTMLVSKLKPMFEKSPHKFKYIVNVSSPEGQFSFTKEFRHPHTNIAKAALNMLTFSIADEYAYDKIFVTSVDPGWVTEQFPLKGRSRKNRRFALSLDDAAARVCDPIFTGVNEQKYWRGYLFKNYKVAKW